MKQPQIHKVLTLWGILALLVFLIVIYKAVYFAWLTATPLSSDELALCRLYYYCCLAIAILSLVAACVFFYYAARKRV
jgi:hypothetical protein